jgi:hypothetical protein
MRKLTVKNFSVIKEAELEFGKITVLIGPQSSGKSLLSKLAFFFSQIVPEIENNAFIGRGKSFDEFRDMLHQRFYEYFPYSAWRGQDFQIKYESKQFDLEIGQRDDNSPFMVLFESGFSDRYNRFIEPAPDGWIRSNIIDPTWIDERVEDGPLRRERSVYIPTSRTAFSTANKGFESFALQNLDWITKRFSTEMDFSFRYLIEAADVTNPLLTEFWMQSRNILGGTVVDKAGIPFFKGFNSVGELPFDLQSSGTLEMLPLLNPLGSRIARAKFPNIPTVPLPAFGTIFVEEPESSVFPNTQYNLVRLFAWMANETTLNNSFAITTHSPYILTAFNNLIEAGQVAKAKPELKEEVAKIIPEQYWIKEGDFRAYAIEGGVLTSIVAEDTGLVSANYLDQVSETIGVEFDELLRLGYVEA